MDGSRLELVSQRVSTVEANLQNDKSSSQEAAAESRKLREKVNAVVWKVNTLI